MVNRMSASAAAQHIDRQLCGRCERQRDPGSVDEIAAGFHKGIIDFAAFIFGRPPASVVAKSHGSQTKLGNLQTTLTQKLIPHGKLPFWFIRDGTILFS